MPEGEEGRLDPVLPRDPVADEVETEAGPLAFGAPRRLGDQISGTRSRRLSSARTRASMRSVLQASGA
ncbi:MAG: hypothetical protein ACLQAN_06835, partial [Acidimicrobiales bacterium]